MVGRVGWTQGQQASHLRNPRGFFSLAISPIRFHLLLSISPFFAALSLDKQQK